MFLANRDATSIRVAISGKVLRDHVGGFHVVFYGEQGAGADRGLRSDQQAPEQIAD